MTHYRVQLWASHPTLAPSLVADMELWAECPQAARCKVFADCWDARLDSAD